VGHTPATPAPGEPRSLQIVCVCRIIRSGPGPHSWELASYEGPAYWPAGRAATVLSDVDPEYEATCAQLVRAPYGGRYNEHASL
jgi:hypothetical protein